MQERDASIELWRVFCMLAVVVSHVLENNGLPGFGYLQWHVIGFLWISGYFGVRLRWHKVVSLILTTYVLYWLTVPFRSSPSFVNLLLPHGGWFLPFYVVLMLVSPVFEAAVKDRSSHGIILVTTSILLFWGWLPVLLQGNSHAGMLSVPGMQGNGLLLVAAVYLISRILGVHKPLAGKCCRVAFLAGFVGLSVLLGLTDLRGGFGSPIVILTAACGFYCFQGIGIPNIVAKGLFLIGPSMWSVYVLHECCLKHWQTPGFVHSVPSGIAWGMALFVICLAIDAVRRVIERCWCKFLRRIVNG